jgi:hypothetical protein
LTASLEWAKAHAVFGVFLFADPKVGADIATPFMAWKKK